MLTRFPSGERRFTGPNLLTAGSDFTNAAWVKSNVTVTANDTTAPDGTATADRITASASVSVAMQQSVVATAGRARAVVFLKKGSGATVANRVRLRNSTTVATLLEANIDLDTGGVTYATGTKGIRAVALSNGWFRVEIETDRGVTSGDTVRLDVCFAGAATSGDYAFAWDASLVTRRA